MQGDSGHKVDATATTLQRALAFVQTAVMIVTAAGLFVVIGRRDETLNNVVATTAKLSDAVAAIAQNEAQHSTRLNHLDVEVARLRDELQRVRSKDK
jgi:putative salt-induced outer membrane protein YdiY